MIPFLDMKIMRNTKTASLIRQSEVHVKYVSLTLLACHLNTNRAAAWLTCTGRDISIHP
jgi:hypothetical protein